MRIFQSLTALLALPLFSPPPATEARYFVVVFASQADSGELSLNHTFATFVKVTEEKPDHPEIHTISWLPENLEIVVWRRFPEPRKNFDLKTTLKWAKSVGAKVMYWGPYEIKKELYDMALQQEEKLTGGKVAYKVLDRRSRPQANSVHAVADVDDKHEILLTGTASGAEASALVVDHFQKWLKNPDQVFPKILEQLGVDTLGASMRSMNSLYGERRPLSSVVKEG
jgi:hypothetical protein